MRRPTHPAHLGKLIPWLPALLLAAGAETSVRAAETAPSAPFLERFPGLKPLLFDEPRSSLYMGFGATPFSFAKNRYFFGASFLQIHFITGSWDIEALNLGVTFTIPQESYSKSRHFTLRSAPKLELIRGFSIGPVVGMEFVSFPEIRARVTKSSYASPFEAFSSSGLIYGAMLSQNVRLGPEGSGKLLKINQVFYRQTYSPTEAGNGWAYNFEQTDLEADAEKAPIRPDSVFLLEFAFLF